MALESLERFAELAVSLGEPFAGAGNLPVRLDDPHIVWFVEHGALDVFVAEYRHDDPAADHKHLLRAATGRLVFGLDEAAAGTSLGLVAKGLPGSRLRRLRLEALLRNDPGDMLPYQVDAWIAEFSAAVARDIHPRPRPDLVIAAGEELNPEAGCVVSARRGVVWTATDGAAFLGTEEPPEHGVGMIPLTPASWLTLPAAAHVRGVSSCVLDSEERLPAALAEFHALALSAEQLNRQLLLADEMNWQTARAAWRRQNEENARRSLFDVLAPARATRHEHDTALAAALEWIGRHEGIAFSQPPRAATPEAQPSLTAVLAASGVRGRKVKLSAEDRWWRGDSGALLAFSRAGDRPVALLPGGAGRYRMVDPLSGRTERVTAERARGLSPDAWFFYRPLPVARAAARQGLLHLVGKNMGGDLVRFVAAGLLAGLLALAPAVIVGMLTDRVLPTAASGALLELTFGLAGIAVLGALLQMLQGTSLMRLEGRAAARIGAAIWDRVLGLQLGFFRRYTAGELTMRLMTFQTLRDQVSGVVANALLSVIFLTPTFALIFLYSAPLGWLSLVIGSFSLALTVVFGLLQIVPQRHRYAAARHFAGALIQFIAAMGKLRTTGAEGTAFAAGARGYRAQQQAVLQIDRLGTHLVAFSTAMPAIAAAALFTLVLLQPPGTTAIGDFLAVYAATIVFYVQVVRLGQSFEAIAAIVPGFQQAAPILTATPEARPGRTAADHLYGEILFDHVSFRYADDGPLILNDLTIRARPGEFVAIVGRSGAGKSTLIRLALGLEQPSAGGVYYDGRDLAHLNPLTVRRQIGVVVQDGALRLGTVLDNITAGQDLTVDDAWRAAHLAAVDGDIAAMPMGMFTPVNDNTRMTFSGGQEQRIRIAAALARKPRIVFLDEATSWLDSQTQAEVMGGIERITATRIVIAHRLSTIRKADRIYVLDAGRVVQEGRFDELYETTGPFRDLMRRQVV
ncbi:MAG: ATP-binding cassette domain-containing protein [Deltaproteobacteria bacterium]|nr:ATP-binding cassette domain-containing protein [Deltaproteobacteria bacterium]